MEILWPFRPLVLKYLTSVTWTIPEPEFSTSVIQRAVISFLGTPVVSLLIGVAINHWCFPKSLDEKFSRHRLGGESLK